MKEGKKFEKIEKVRIPDEDVPGWIETLQKGGFNNDEIDLIVGNLNVEYKKARNPNYVEEELERVKEDLFKKMGRSLTQEEIEHLRKGIESRLEE